MIKHTAEETEDKTERPYEHVLAQLERSIVYELKYKVKCLEVVVIYPHGYSDSKLIITLN